MLLTYGNDSRQYIHKRKELDATNKCVYKVSQCQSISNGQQSGYGNEHRLGVGLKVVMGIRVVASIHTIYKSFIMCKKI